jgi:hypothetical protein
MALGNIYDQNGRLQVSMNMLGMTCRRSGTGTTQSRVGGNTSPSSIAVDVSGFSYPVVAIRIENYAAAFSSKNGGTNYYACSAPIGTGFAYYAFDWTPTVPNTSATLKLYDDVGRCSFNSNFFPMSITNIFNAVGQTVATNGRVYATAQGQMGGHSHRGEALCYDSGGPKQDGGEGLGGCRDIRYQNDGKLYGGGFNPGANTVGMYAVSWDDVRVSAGNYSNYTSGDVRGWDCPTTVMAVDVTDIPVGATFF